MKLSQVQQQRVSGFQGHQRVAKKIQAKPSELSNAIQKPSFVEGIKKNLATLTAASVIAMSQGPALANEMAVYSEAPPVDSFVVDDAGVLSKVSKGSIAGKLKQIKKDTGYTIDVVTIRKLEFEPDAFQFGDKLRQKWFGDDPKSAILLLVSAAKDGAVVGGPDFVNKLGEEFLDSVTGGNIPFYTDKQKFNEGVDQTINRIAAVLENKQDPGAPEQATKNKKRTYKTKEETGKTKLITATIVVVLLLIAFVVPMLQYFGYVNE